MAASTETWAEILRAAVKRGVEQKNAAIPGARLRGLVVKVAAEKGIAYPPEDNPSLKFASFLEQHPGVVAVRKEPNTDLYVAPSDKPELLVEIPSPRGPLAGIRQDLFEAFTRIRQGSQVWYDKARDTVEWHPADAKLDESKYVKIPSPTIEELRAARKKFATEQSDLTIRATLEKAVESQNVLPAFAAAVRESGLGAAWHQFRIRLLVDIIGVWATKASLQWQEAWITSSGRVELSPTDISKYEPRDWRKVITLLAQNLDQQDLARISVPLDLVIKIIQQSR